MRLKSTRVKTNVELAPFQHVTVELTAEYDKTEDRDEVREGLTDEIDKLLTAVKEATNKHRYDRNYLPS